VWYIFSQNYLIINFVKLTIKNLLNTTNRKVIWKNYYQSSSSSLNKTKATKCCHWQPRTRLLFCAAVWTKNFTALQSRCARPGSLAMHFSHSSFRGTLWINMCSLKWRLTAALSSVVHALRVPRLLFLTTCTPYSIHYYSVRSSKHDSILHMSLVIKTGPFIL